MNSDGGGRLMIGQKLVGILQMSHSPPSGESTSCLKIYFLRCLYVVTEFLVAMASFPLGSPVY